MPWKEHAQHGKTYKAGYAESSSDNPNFVLLRSKGEFLPPRAYNFDGYQASANEVPIPSSSLTYSDIQGGNTTSLGAIVLGQAPTGIPAQKWPYAGINTASKLHSHLRHILAVDIREAAINLPLAILEARKTVTGLGKIVSEIANSMRALRRGWPLEALNILIWGDRGQMRNTDLSQALANRWLEWTYGVKPLMMDAEGLALGLAKVVSRPESMISQMTVRMSEAMRADSSHDVNTSINTLFYTCGFNTVLRGRGDLWFRTLDPVQAGLEDFGFTSVLDTVWELIPFSFVVDWFLPVQSFLSVLKPVNGLQFMGGCTYIKGRCDIHKSSGRRKLYTSQSKTRSEYRSRLILGSFPSDPPPVDLGLDGLWKRMETAVALLRNAAKPTAFR